MAGHFTEIYEGNARSLVFGEGSFHSRLMMIGEAPGEQETLKGRPFVGKAGKNLDEFLQMSGLKREEIYITNTVKFRPTKRSDAGRLVNRPPTKEEIALFYPFLLREIELVKPEYVVTLGNVPLKALAGDRVVIGDVHGQFLECEGRVLYPLYHPASLIYNPSLRGVYAEDVKRLGDWLRNRENG
mgnify:FL=1